MPFLALQRYFAVLAPRPQIPVGRRRYKPNFEGATSRISKVLHVEFRRCYKSNFKVATSPFSKIRHFLARGIISVKHSFERPVFHALFKDIPDDRSSNDHSSNFQ